METIVGGRVLEATGEVAVNEVITMTTMEAVAGPVEVQMEEMTVVGVGVAEATAVGAGFIILRRCTMIFLDIFHIIMLENIDFWLLEKRFYLIYIHISFRSTNSYHLPISHRSCYIVLRNISITRSIFGNL